LGDCVPQRLRNVTFVADQAPGLEPGPVVDQGVSDRSAIGGRNDVLKFTNAAEKEAFALAEALSDKGMACMKQAEEAAETFRAGKMQMRRQFKARGLSEVDADIRWSGMTVAKKALSDNGWYMSQASMYNEAAAAQYAKALYLRSAPEL
jgi:hypothetical protein